MAGCCLTHLAGCLVTLDISGQEEASHLFTFCRLADAKAQPSSTTPGKLLNPFTSSPLRAFHCFDLIFPLIAGFYSWSALPLLLLSAACSQLTGWRGGEMSRSWMDRAGCGGEMLSPWYLACADGGPLSRNWAQKAFWPMS